MTTAATFKSGSLRPIDLARSVGLSTQAVRNYEDDGILPSAIRGRNGYRRYTYFHLSALEAFLALARAASHSSARSVMRAINSDRLDDALEVIDTVHGQLLKDRQTVRTIQSALVEIDSEVPLDRSRISTFTIGDLAHRLGVTSTTLRGWEQAGILSPNRQASTGHRHYSNEDARDAELAHLLRRGGQRLSSIAMIIREIRNAGSTTALREATAQWHSRLNEQGRALLKAAGLLASYVSERASMTESAPPPTSI
ncbi:MAG TPA: MerR family DNA-binding transcriptional regulator [Lacisediminihabitans sp.]|uniref:MerR family DNA-binding transcriptional regulator n=1 Tax=Lacisediminihabitans sp. TaxID=2787631 RepID=UPI002ED777D5